MKGDKSHIMKYSIELIRMLQLLSKKGCDFTENFVIDINKIVKRNVELFARDFYKDVSRLCEMNKEEYVGKFEILNLTQSQKKQLKGNLLIRYEYRRFSNLRCIFVREYDYNYNRYKYIFLCAFNEDASKKKGIIHIVIIYKEQ